MVRHPKAIEKELYKQIEKESYPESENNSTSALDVFLYLLMRDHVTPGTIEKVMRDVMVCRGELVKFSNPYLEQYAQDLSERLLDDGAGTEKFNLGPSR